MTTMEGLLLAAIVLLALMVAGMLAVGVRLVRRLAAPTAPTGQPLSVIVDDPEAVAERERQRQTLVELQNSVSDAQTALEAERRSVAAARAEATAVRAENAAAKAEVTTSRAEAQRVLDAAHAEADTVLQRAHRQAEEDAEQVRSTARRTGEREIAMLTSTAKDQAAEAERRLQRLDERERMHAAEAERLAERERQNVEEAERLAERDRRIAAAEAELAKWELSLQGKEQELAQAQEQRRKELERVAGLTADAAKSELVETIEVQAKREAALLVRDIEADARSTGESRARHIVVDAIQRVASEQTAESVVSVLHLPSDEMKGRIIGREGRNIRAFETVTGVNLIIDDTPEAVLLSCFDPVRREVGRLTLEKLVLDGRIHPHRIEEVYDVARFEVERMCQRAAEDALVEVGITDIHPELVTLLGRLRYRTSYGQNVLKHLVETAHIAGIMASELKLDPELIKRSAFLHDIGKALTHEVEGSHALIGADVARRFGESDEVVHAIEAHHNEVQPQTIEAVLTQASDACSGGRPGARRESLEAYVKRLERIEEIAGAKSGVDKVFAMQAGREIRVMVRPEEVDEIGAAVLARDVAKQIEEELTYPGQIRITVVRESRTTEIAR
ncbi:ribonuclease Y [Catellatospora sp. NPDC049111]|uniref:ribonuclease Y n=1 Tax=Catellatospora sp. NPDC049111 TaxID=3155271 RepID=UPI0033F3E3E3